MPLDTSPESPAPVRTISRMLADWINRLGAVWIDGQVAEYRPRPGARFHYFVLRDTDVDMSLSVKADAAVIGRLDPPLAEGQRVLVHARPDFYAGRGSLSMQAREIRPVGIGALLAQLEQLKALLAAEGLFAPERQLQAVVQADAPRAAWRQAQFADPHADVCRVTGPSNHGTGLPVAPRSVTVTANGTFAVTFAGGGRSTLQLPVTRPCNAERSERNENGP